MDPQEIKQRRKRSIEVQLLALFDAQQRIAEEKKRVLDKYDGPDERGAVIESFEAATDQIASTAIDNVHQRIDQTVENQDSSNSDSNE